MKTGFVTTTDGVELYYSSHGTGTLTLVCCNGVGVSTYFWRHINEAFSDTYQIITWDYVGHGRSSTPTDIDSLDLSISRHARDLNTILSVLEVKQPVVLLGHSMGVQVILEYYFNYPAQVQALIPMLGSPGKSLDTLLGFSGFKKLFPLLAMLVNKTGSNAARVFHPILESSIPFALGRRTGMMNYKRASQADMRHYFKHMTEIDPALFLEMVIQLGNHDLEPRLSEVKIPVLVIAGERDMFTPLHRSEKMAEKLPNSQLVILEGGSHAAIVEHTTEINDHIARFVLATCGDGGDDGGSVTLSPQPEGTQS
jgi:pimeloyl-ACP methyl ester carboxylesterase